MDTHTPFSHAAIIGPIAWLCFLTISITSTSAGIRSWYRNAAKSFFIWILLSSISESPVKDYAQICVYCVCSCAEVFACEDTCYGEYPEVTVSPDFVLTQQKGQEHEEPSIVNYPPYINVALHPVLIAREPIDPFGDQHCQLFPGRYTDALCTQTCPHFNVTTPPTCYVTLLV